MGWGDAFKKIGGVVKDGVVESGKVALAGATGGASTALIEKHGDEISEAFGEIGEALEKVDALADKIDGQLVTKEQADRIEGMLEELLARVSERKRKPHRRRRQNEPTR